MSSDVSMSLAQWGKSESTMESLVAQSYSEIPLEERNELLNELHGVSKEFDETPQIVRERLNEIEHELTMITDKEAYDMAYSMSPEFVNDTTFRMMFLRAETFDAKRSAKRMVHHFQDKLDLFGKDLLTREILLSDLTDNEANFLRQGRQQPLLQRDRGGRLLFFLMRQVAQERLPIKSRLRISWYNLMSCVEGDVLTQKRGMVFIWWCISKDKLTYKQSNIAKSIALMSSLPLRFAGIHVCSNDSKVRPFLNFGAHLVEHRLRIRVRFHFGTPQEVIYALMTFGVPREILPVDEDGNMTASFFNIWLGMRAEKERAIRDRYASTEMSDTNTAQRVMVPGYFDVLLGRGKAIETSPGNKYLRLLISGHYDRYDDVARCEKNVVCLWILGMIQEKGGKFMKKNGDHGWVEVPEAKAIDKISHDFRNYRVRGAAVVSNRNDRVGTGIKRSVVWS